MTRQKVSPAAVRRRRNPVVMGEFYGTNGDYFTSPRPLCWLLEPLFLILRKEIRSDTGAELRPCLDAERIVDSAQDARLTGLVGGRSE
ncbi:MAG: hypothetical protein RLZZ199_218 [Actinomycetota bacterium]